MPIGSRAKDARPRSQGLYLAGVAEGPGPERLPASSLDRGVKSRSCSTQPPPGAVSMGTDNNLPAPPPRSPLPVRQAAVRQNLRDRGVLPPRAPPGPSPLQGPAVGLPPGWGSAPSPSPGVPRVGPRKASSGGAEARQQDPNQEELGH